MSETPWWKRKQTARLLVVGLAIVLLFVVGKLSGASEYATPARIQQMLIGCGFLGVIAFLAVFTAGSLIFVPGMIFVAAAVFTYGQLAGGLIGLAGAVFAVTISFVVFRRLGGQPLGAIKNRFMQRLLRQLEHRPLRSMILLRSVFFISPPLNSALALSNIRFRDYALGSLVGLVAPIALASILIDRLIKWIG